MTQLPISKEEYTQLLNSRDEEGSSYRAIHKLYKEVCLTKQSFTAFIKRLNMSAAYLSVKAEGGTVVIYDYNRGYAPICIIVPDGQWITIHLKISELPEITETINNIKTALNVMIIQG